uniref:Cytochrome P450 n=1 Tax=Kalanchoe fedtschenkoi TaxID=63787 RepID=A0A7N0RIQ9_KALFE
MAHTWEMLDSQLASSLLYLFLFALFLFIWFHSKLSSKKLQAPSPPRLPIIGNLHQLGSYPHRALAALAQRHGPLMMLRLGSAPTFVVSSGKVVEEMVKKHDIAFSNRHDSTIYRRMMYDCKDLLLAPYGEYWRQMRGVCFSQLLSPKMVQSLQYLREQETNLLMEKIKGFNTTPFDLSHLFEYLTKDIVYIATLGKRFSEGQSTEDKLTRLFVEFNALLGLFNVGDYIPWLSWINHFNGLNERIENNHREINELLEEVINDQLARRTSNNEAKEKVLLDALLDAQNGDSVTRESAKAVILDVFAGGIDTVFVVLEWAMTELIRNPEILKRTQQQIREIVGGQNQITKHDISKMTYLKAVIKESMRMHPPFPLIPRVSNQEVELHGYTIPNKTRLLINIYAVGRDPECWEEPDTFKPERFMNDGSLIEYNSNDYSWMAFGAGRRGCPGGLFGMTLIEFVIASLLQNFDWPLPDGKTEKDVDMDEFVALALHKLQPLIAVATPNPDI